MSEFGDSPVWLNDSRRLIFFEKNKIFLLDSLTRKPKETMTLPPTDILQGITISPENRFVYYSLGKKDSNIWLTSSE